jgi:hypothetical protein
MAKDVEPHHVVLGAQSVGVLDFFSRASGLLFEFGKGAHC